MVMVATLWRKCSLWFMVMGDLSLILSNDGSQTKLAWWIWIERLLLLVHEFISAQGELYVQQVGKVGSSNYYYIIIIIFFY
jgi:hypothetical protein